MGNCRSRRKWFGIELPVNLLKPAQHRRIPNIVSGLYDVVSIPACGLDDLKGILERPAHISVKCIRDDRAGEINRSPPKKKIKSPTHTAGL